MRAAVLEAVGTPLQITEMPAPRPAVDEVVVEVQACGICRTDLHVVDGELPAPRLPLIPGHQVVGRVVEAGQDTALLPGTRVGIPWLAWTCGQCDACRRGQENLCDYARFTGYSVNGGFAELVCANAAYCFPLPGDLYSDIEAAPLLCAGLIGYRAWRKTGDAERVGLYGFGSAAHLIGQVAKFQGRDVAAFTRAGDEAAQSLALELGADWAGPSDAAAPFPLDAAIIFAPVGELVPQALTAVRKGGIVVCAGIHMSDIPAFPYAYIWEERQLVSVANMTRDDGHEFLSLAAEHKLKVAAESLPLTEVNRGLDRLRRGAVRGSLVVSLSQ